MLVILISSSKRGRVQKKTTQNTNKQKQKLKTKQTKREYKFENKGIVLRMLMKGSCCKG